MITTSTGVLVSARVYDDVGVCVEFSLGGNQYACVTLYHGPKFSLSGPDESTVWETRINWSSFGSVPVETAHKFSDALAMASALGDQLGTAPTPQARQIAVSLILTMYGRTR